MPRNKDISKLTPKSYSSVNFHARRLQSGKLSVWEKLANSRENSIYRWNANRWGSHDQGEVVFGRIIKIASWPSSISSTNVGEVSPTVERAVEETLRFCVFNVGTLCIRYPAFAGGHTIFASRKITSWWISP